MPIKVFPLPYPEPSDASISWSEYSAAVFEKFLRWPYPIFLDSAGHLGIDYIFADPVAIYKSVNPQQYYLIENGTQQLNESSLWDALAKRYQYERNEHTLNANDFFCGGIVGVSSYDWGAAALNVPLSADAQVLAWYGVYRWCICIDHIQKKSWLTFVSEHEAEKSVEKIVNQINKDVEEFNEFRLLENWKSNFTEAEYENAFHKVINYLKSGDCYQVNLAQRFDANYVGDPWHAYRQLRLQNKAPFSAYLKLDELSILSLSPERFLRFEQNKAITQPIKGTRPRSDNVEIDAQLVNQLLASEKDKAENLMIVDLLRNDLSKTCELGSVTVDELFSVQSFSAVHHLVSTISATLAQGETAFSCFNGCFPGGSITGAPKIRAMQIIHELEPNARSVYCGSIAYFGFNGMCDSNIAIRTLQAENNRISTWAGGGIVIDSEWENEYQETFDKIARITQVLQPNDIGFDLIFPALHINKQDLEHYFSNQTGNLSATEIYTYNPDFNAHDIANTKALKDAAVLVPIVLKEKLSILLTQRTQHLRSHSGQISFPGGKLDAGETTIEAALREAEEEIGLSATKIKVLGTLPEHITGSGFRIMPIVAFVDSDYSLIINHNEVESAFEVPLDFLLDPENYSLESLFWEGKQRLFYQIPYFDDILNINRGIWGATAAILFSFYECLLASDLINTR